MARKPVRPKEGPIKTSDWVPPEYLSSRARAEFERLVDILRADGTLSSCDPRLVESYAINYDLLASAHQSIKKVGMTVKSPRGHMVPNPLLQTINQASIRLKSIISEIQLSPGSRNASGGGETEQGADRWGDLLVNLN